ncbi:MAG: molybdopterin-guanine dinucleotide biosynthesis protein MobB [Desulfurococcaceae archaeon TW002]
MNPYVVRFISASRKRGKTFVATQVVSELVSRGYVVGVVKHSRHGVDVASKDSSRYVGAGAKEVLVSSSSVGVVFYSGWVDDLEYLLGYLSTSVIVVEGFKESSIGDVVVVVDNLREFQVLSKATHNIIAVVTENEEVRLELSKSLKVFRKNEVSMITDLIESRLLDFLENQTPKTNCGYCGFETCRALVKAYATGKTRWCPVKSGVSLLVNDNPVPMNPFVKNVLRSIIEGFISSLKGVNVSRKKIIIEIN